jgi:hypothetical protein
MSYAGTDIGGRGCVRCLDHGAWNIDATPRVELAVTRGAQVWHEEPLPVSYPGKWTTLGPLRTRSPVGVCTIIIFGRVFEPDRFGT